MKNLLLLLAFAFLFSCKVKQPIQQVPIQYREVVTTHLVPVVNPADSANITALFACDSLNRVILKSLSEIKSKDVTGQSTFSDGKFIYKFITKHDTIFIHVTDTVRSKDVPVVVNVPFEVNKINGWQNFQIWLGRILLIIVLAWGAWTLLKPKIL